MNHPDISGALARDRQRHLLAEAERRRRVRRTRRGAVRPPGEAAMQAGVAVIPVRAPGRSAVEPLR